MKKLTNEELSRVLTAHELGGLVRFGQPYLPAYPACILQVARSEAPGLTSDLEWEKARWFDSNYNHNWTVEQFLEEMERAGLA